MKLLNYANLNAHRGRPCTPSGKHLTLWHTSDSFLHCCIESQGCKFSKEGGACVMCDYGVGRNLVPADLKSALENILQPALYGIKTILFGSYGSVLDEYEISGECLDVILDFASKCSFDNIIFETHYSTVTSEKLLKIKNALGNKFNITIEMGYESCDEYILSNCLGKVMDLEELMKTISLICNEGMEVSLNVFLGAPFISVRDQTLSAVKSVEWAFSNGANSVVVFPSNIKPFTLMYDLYKAGYYSEISQWQVIDVLDHIPDEYLDRVSLSWFGDRKNFYEDDQYPLLPPKDCEKCHEKIFSFYRNFRNANSGNLRKALLSELLKNSADCSCRSEYLHSFNGGGKRLSKEQIWEIVGNVKKLLNTYGCWIITGLAIICFILMRLLKIEYCFRLDQYASTIFGTIISIIGTMFGLTAASYAFIWGELKSEGESNHKLKHILEEYRSFLWNLFFNALILSFIIVIFNLLFLGIVQNITDPTLSYLDRENEKNIIINTYYNENHINITCLVLIDLGLSVLDILLMCGLNYCVFNRRWTYGRIAGKKLKKICGSYKLDLPESFPQKTKNSKETFKADSTEFNKIHYIELLVNRIMNNHENEGEVYSSNYREERLLEQIVYLKLENCRHNWEYMLKEQKRENIDQIIFNKTMSELNLIRSGDPN